MTTAIEPEPTDPLRQFAGRSTPEGPDCTDPQCAEKECEATFEFFPYKGSLNWGQLNALVVIQEAAPKDATYRFKRWGKMHGCRHSNGCNEPTQIAVEVIVKVGQTVYSRLIDL